MLGSLLTKAWAKHLREGAAVLEDLLEDGHVIYHPFTVGELACGDLKKRTEILTMSTAGRIEVILRGMEKVRINLAGIVEKLMNSRTYDLSSRRNGA